MENGAVYEDTTEPQDARACRFCSPHLGRLRLALKALQLLFSFVAFICEEIVESCTSCNGLYFFEFVSCSALLLSLLLLVVYCTTLYEKFGDGNIRKTDLVTTAIVSCFFILASIVFAATNDKSSVETLAIVFGFLASLAFLGDLIYMFMEGRKEANEKKENPNQQGPPENQPLKNEGKA
ncbi:PREDICTED: CKLF-like MARVEL transmembrane domain-containing protein 6 [Gavialis gangeticus]|uniref:CKLF-like MARVEL transmembrane domain-containing protein 6 n=1 Tax=Gavialis gangeticus TaxID=94835 RepID=UPI00092EBAF9|nr:PREDICTED: CKLF-like MARVEL transmembrane domain-containing protein 6 [Gavialis gangeticus]